MAGGMPGIPRGLCLADALLGRTAGAARDAHRGIEVDLACFNAQPGALAAALAALVPARLAPRTRRRADERTHLRRHPRPHEQLHLPWCLEPPQPPPAPTRNYISRGVWSSSNAPAAQADLHAATAGGTFSGVWGSTRDSQLEPYADFELEVYLGHRFDLSNAWSATFSGRAHYFLGGPQEVSDDYQEISAALSWLDAWTISLTGIPNAVRYWRQERLSRAPAFVAETTAQWLLYRGFFLTGGVGY